MTVSIHDRKGKLMTSMNRRDAPPLVDDKSWLGELGALGKALLA